MPLRLPIIILITVLTGCTQSPSVKIQPVLADSSWLAMDIDDTGVTDKLQFTLIFGSELNVSGISGCNRYSGQATINGADIEFGPLATTRMACPEATMNQEDRFLRVLSAAAKWSLDTDQENLTLLDEGGRPTLRFSRVTAQN